MSKWNVVQGKMLFAVLLAGLALLLAACDLEPTPGPIGPPTAGPSPTAVPTETPVSLGGSGGELYRQANAAMSALTSYRYVLETTLGRGATQQITGDWAAPSKLRMTVVNRGAGIGGTQQILRIGPDQWTRKTDADTWQKAPASTVSLSPDQAAGILRFASSIEKTEDQQLDGATVPHLTFMLDPNKLGGGAGLAKGSGELWLETNTSRILQMRLNFTSGVTGAMGEAQSLLRLSQFNVPVEINSP